MNIQARIEAFSRIDLEKETDEILNIIKTTDLNGQDEELRKQFLYNVWWDRFCSLGRNRKFDLLLLNWLNKCVERNEVVWEDEILSGLEYFTMRLGMHSHIDDSIVCHFYSLINYSLLSSFHTDECRNLYLSYFLKYLKERIRLYDALLEFEPDLINHPYRGN